MVENYKIKNKKYYPKSNLLCILIIKILCNYILSKYFYTSPCTFLNISKYSIFLPKQNNV